MTLPLEGVRVLAVEQYGAGPFGTMFLADQGAEVIKIEPPAGDETRALGPPFDEQGDAAYFLAVNRGKRGIALDLAQPAGQATLLALLEGADVLVENFIPGTMARWGLDYEAVLQRRFPRLVYCAISGFGETGPAPDRPAFDLVAQGMGGGMSLTGYADGEPLRAGIPIGDLAGGLFGALGVLSAVQARHEQVQLSLRESGY